MKPGHVLDPATGQPRVVPVRTNDGNLVFAYETRRPGGMVVLVDIPTEALSGGPTADSPAATLNEQLARAARVVVEKLTAGDVETAPDPASFAVGSTPEVIPDAAEVARREEAEALARAAAARVEQAEDEISQRDLEIEELRQKLAEAEEKPAPKPAARKARAKATA